MNSIIESLTGMDKLSDQTIAIDFLVSAKSAVRSYSIALTESMSPQVREVLKNQLYAAMATHQTIFNYMMKKGYYHAYDLQEQYKVDMKLTDVTLGLTKNK